MADTYIWHDFCGQASGPDLLNIYYKCFGRSAVGDKLIAHNNNGDFIIDNQIAYQAVLDGSQCSLLFSNGARLYIYRDQYLHAYLRVKTASITFTFPENRKCKIKYFTNQGSSAGNHSWDSDNGQITVPASDINFLYEFNYQTSIATNMAYRNNGTSYLKYANFMTDTSSHSDWHSDDATSVGNIDKSDEAVGHWTNIKHYSIPNYYISQSGNSERGMRKIDAVGVPNVSKGTSDIFRYNSTPGGLKSENEINWQFIDWIPEIWYDGTRLTEQYYAISNGYVQAYSGSSMVKTAPINNDDVYYKIEWEATYRLTAFDSPADPEIGRDGDWNWGRRDYGATSDVDLDLYKTSGGFSYKKATSDGWIDISSLEREYLDQCINTSIPICYTVLSSYNTGWQNQWTVSSLPDDSNFFNNYITIVITAGGEVTADVGNKWVFHKNDYGDYEDPVISKIEVSGRTGWQSSWEGGYSNTYLYVPMNLDIYLTPGNFATGTTLSQVPDHWLGMYKSGPGDSHWESKIYWKTDYNINIYTLGGKHFLIIKFTKKES